MEAKDSYQQTPLHRASANGHEKAVKELIKYKAKLDSLAQINATPVCCRFIIISFRFFLFLQF